MIYIAWPLLVLVTVLGLSLGVWAFLPNRRAFPAIVYWLERKGWIRRREP